MLKPTAGLQAFHQGVPVEFLYLMGKMGETELWWVKPLFVNDPPFAREIDTRYHNLTKLHTQRKTA